MPSAVSAVKVDGKRAYARVRAGEDVVLAARTVSVSRFDVVDVRRVDADDSPSSTSMCASTAPPGPTSGRSPATSAPRSASAAISRSLRRTPVGPYGLDVARTLDDLAESFAVVPIAAAARAAFPVRELDVDEARRLVHGRRLAAVGLGEQPTAAFAPDGSLVAIISETGPTARPLLVLQG